MTIPTATSLTLWRNAAAVFAGLVAVIALILGGIGQILSLAGAIVAITAADLGPAWFPIALVLTALPCAWLGGSIHLRRHTAR